jgi:hypothetical protein
MLLFCFKKKIKVSNFLCYVFSEAVLETQSPQKEFALAAQRIKTPQKEVGNELLDIDDSDSVPMESSVQDGTARVETSELETLLVSSSSNSEVNA